MDNGEQVLVKMNDLLASWEVANDRRSIFLSCYKMMTQNVVAAIRANEFEDTPWVATLMDNFAEYYFQALDAYENKADSPPDVWRIAFIAAQNPRTHVLVNLVLGVNAHINYDLVFALSELLAGEWGRLSPAQRQMRYRDHCRINLIISNTIDEVKYQIIDPYQPLIGVVDKIFGPLDDWMTSLLISEWREEVWKHATRLLDTGESDIRTAIVQQVHQLSLDRAQDILGKANLHDLVEFI
ncbi:MAG TPA: DUF5995 family protein [Anaerolineaceae bacterium]|nr:DUF5995 family protein [Anaerolineaceae bacterium]